MKRTRKKKKPISVKARKAKARRLQGWVCERISYITGCRWGQQGEDAPIESRGMGQKGVDVRMESHVLKQFPFSIECKNQETWAIPAWIKQSTNNRIKGTDWLLICGKNNHATIAILDAQVFFAIYKEILDMSKTIDFLSTQREGEKK